MKTSKRPPASFLATGKLRLVHAVAPADPTLAYAVAELKRLLGRLGLTPAAEAGKKSATTLLTLALVPAGAKADVPPTARRDVARLRHDRYLIQVSGSAIVLAGHSGKALLNAV